jgi:hypothetical protein
MSGTVSVPIKVQDGFQLPFIVTDANPVTLGQVVELYSDGTVFPATTSSTRVVGAAYLANRITHDQTDNTIAAGLYVTVVTRGVCNLTIGSGVTLAAGDIVAAYSPGRVGGSAAYGDRIGKCLVGGTGDASGTVYATVLLNI